MSELRTQMGRTRPATNQGGQVALAGREREEKKQGCETGRTRPLVESSRIRRQRPEVTRHKFNAFNR